MCECSYILVGAIKCNRPCVTTKSVLHTHAHTLSSFFYFTTHMYTYSATLCNMIEYLQVCTYIMELSQTPQEDLPHIDNY